MESLASQSLEGSQDEDDEDEVSEASDDNSLSPALLASDALMEKAASHVRMSKLYRELSNEVREKDVVGRNVDIEHGNQN